MAKEPKIAEADADRLASHFGLAPEAVRALIGLDARTAANQLGVGEADLTYALQDKVRAEQARIASEEAERANKRAKDNDTTKYGESELEKPAKKAPAKKAPAKKAAKKASPRKTAAKRSAKKR